MKARYAIYFIPERQTRLAKLGSDLLGRDSETGEKIPQAVLPGISHEKLHNLTTDARRYGLHATLKAPFFLQYGLTERDLLDAAARFTMIQKSILVPTISLVRIGSFFALVPQGNTPEDRMAAGNINAMAAEAVSFFDSFRAEPTEEETARRKPHTLSARQREHLAIWGYPYVFDEYRFHITLTDKIHDQAEADSVEEGLRSHVREICTVPLSITGICVCRQEVDEHASVAHPFMLLRRFLTPS